MFCAADYSALAFFRIVPKLMSMNPIIILIIAGLAIMVVVSLVRGLIAFLRVSKEDIDNPGVSKSHEMQNKMMFARVKYQAMAVIAIVVLLAFGRG